MRIAVMVDRLIKNSGVAKHAIYLSREFASMGHKVTVWTFECVDEEQFYPELTADLEINSRGWISRSTFESSRIPGFRMAGWLRSVQVTYQEQKSLSDLIPNEYDVLNPHGNNIIWSAAEYKRRYRVPVVWMCNDFWPVANYEAKLDSPSLQKLKHFILKYLTLPISNYDRNAVSQINKIAVLSEIVRLQMARYYNVSPILVRKGVDVDRFVNGDGGLVKSKYSIPTGSFLLLTVCMLMPRRRLEDVIRAVGILVNEGYDVTYLIAGDTTFDPEYTSFIQAEIAAHQLTNHVLLAGEVSEDELAGCYQACNAFIWPADENQSWGSAGMEAMSAARPVIVSKENGLSEILVDKMTGFLVQPRSPIAIANVIKNLISDPAFSRSVGRAGQKLMRERYSWRNYAQRMLELFQDARSNLADIH